MLHLSRYHVKSFLVKFLKWSAYRGIYNTTIIVTQILN